MRDKAVLLHGWNTKLYNKQVSPEEKSLFGWASQNALVNELSTTFDLSYYRMPGFCGREEPQNTTCLSIENYANDFEEWKNGNCPDPELIIGFSFGGAIALQHKVQFNDKTPLILLAPALTRSEAKYSRFANFIKNIIPEAGNKYFREFYQFLFSSYYRQGTPFLRNTYNEIVRLDLSSLLTQVTPGGVFLIYGTKDLATPWEKVEPLVTSSKLDYFLVENGLHNIGASHPNQVAERIVQFFEKTTV